MNAHDLLIVTPDFLLESIKLAIVTKFNFFIGEQEREVLSPLTLVILCHSLLKTVATLHDGRSWYEYITAAFFLALIVGCSTYYYKIVENEYFGYPQEWFPSVSAATGDRYPARAIFQILIALTSGPRFLIVGLWYYYTTYSIRSSSILFGKFLLAVGLSRTVSSGGWVYITSTDDHRVHDIAMVFYVLCTLPWQFGVLYTSSPLNKRANKLRKYLILAFFGTLPFMIHFFIQHKIHRVPGAYTLYALLEWSLILYDVAFDAMTLYDFENLELRLTQPVIARLKGGKASAKYV
ncbi:Frag1/DRAM/Sfk1 family-domain-containing protein [Mycotypha africana]|uniref:Frag1/DRAM/Sfk1 family-domain-containing protein n=1 Tax=Mycotypha africana TaxID=64632 RepID=UPI002300A341|nr:Frag1/DRAM/Sfk1 family-domain-containing protein [Mycotypha africana]KAI8982030.1 Frag1/DRAM/Sfk1 family-domain-containing protein [Mycotypha africana]